MKKFFLITILALVPFMSSKADTFKLEAGTDAYYITDDAHRDLNEARLFAPTNQYKDRFGINNALILGKGEGDFWKANVGVGMLDGGIAELEEANIQLRLCGNLWIQGGYFYSNVPGDYDRFSWDNWFTTSSITTDLAPYKEAGMGLKYQFSEDITGNFRIVNTGWNGLEDNNRSKSVSLRFDFANIVKDWSLNIGTIIGNEQSNDSPEAMQTFTAFEFAGKLTDNLEGILQGQFGTRADAKINDAGEKEMGMTYGVTAAAKYHFMPKFAVAGRISYSDNKDGALYDYQRMAGMMFGLALEYRPIEFGYLRLEGNYLSMNSENEDMSKVFGNTDDPKNSRMDIGISAGVYFDVFSLTH